MSTEVLKGIAAVEPRSRLGDEVAVYFDLLHESVYRYLVSTGGEPAEAEDLTQEVFIKAYQHLSQGGELSNPRAWIFKVAHNLATDRHRRRSRTENWVSLESVGTVAEAASAKNAEQQMIDDQQSERLARGLAFLSPQERHCLELRAEGLRYRDIAESLEIDVSTVRTFIVRAVAKLSRAQR